MKPIPCKDCICLAICKSQVNDYINEIKYCRELTSANLSYNVYQSVLCNRCDLITIWFRDHRAGITIKNSIFEYLKAINEIFCKDHQYNQEINNASNSM